MASGPSTPRSTRSRRSSNRSRRSDDRVALIQEMKRKEEHTHTLLAEVSVRLDKLGSRTPPTRVLEGSTHDLAEGKVAAPQANKA